MSRNGSGTYSLPAGNPVVAGTDITVTWGNTTLSDIATALTASISNDGQTPILANLPMSGYKHTGAGSATASGQYLVYGQAGVLASTTITTTTPELSIETTSNSTASVYLNTWGLDRALIQAQGGSGAGSGTGRGNLIVQTANSSGVLTTALTIDGDQVVGVGVTPTSRNNTSLQIVNGIGFPATQVSSSDANTLDDYEEGTWTPSPTNLTVVGTPTYAGVYTKIGRLVHCTFSATSTTSTASTANTTYFTGLPFTPARSAACHAANNSVNGGVGILDAGSSRVYTPTWGAAAAAYCSFTYEV